LPSPPLCARGLCANNFLARRHDDRDVARALKDLRCASLCPGAVALHRWALINVRLGNDQVAFVECLIGLIGQYPGISHGTAHDLENRCCCTLRCEPQNAVSLAGPLATDEVHDAPGL